MNKKKETIFSTLLLIIFLNLSFTHSFGQDYPNVFKLGDFLEIYNVDSIKVFFDIDGRIVDGQCANYYRVGKIDPINCNVKGIFTDHYLNSEVMFRGFMQNNALNGMGRYYYQNGSIKETGLYDNDTRTGLWKYYYPNGILEKALFFNNTAVKILTFITINGDTILKNGNGYYWGPLYKHQSKLPFLVSGPVRDSLMDGEWTLDVPSYSDSLMIFKSRSSEELLFPPRIKIGKEFYKKGYFLKGIDRSGSENGSQIIFVHDFVVNEYLNIYNNSFGCGVEKKATPPFYSKDKYFTGLYFFPELRKEIKKTLKDNFSEQWLIVNLQINDKNKLDKATVFSSINDTDTEKTIGEILQKKFSSWKSLVVNNKRHSSNLFFTILIGRKDVIIPVYETHQNYY
jgi:hypothetical protein